MWLKWTKRILASLGILVVVFIGFFAAVIHIYEDEIKQYAVEQLNTHLKVKVKAPDIELTLWDQFPKASLRFRNTLIPDYTSENEADTLLFAKNIYFSFSFFDMLAGRYNVKEIEIKDALVNLKIDASGTENYDIWKSDTTASTNNKFSFKLEEFTGENVSINYHNLITQQHYDYHANELQLQGDFTEDIFQLKSTTTGVVKQFESNDIRYLSDKNVQLDFDLKVEKPTSTYSIKKGNITIEELLFNLQGTYFQRNDSSYIDIGIKGKNIDLASTFSIFPLDYLSPLKKYKTKGLVVFDASIKGLLNDHRLPHIKASFYVENGSLTEKKSGISLHNISLDGTYDSKTKEGISILQLNEIYANFGIGTLTGKLSINDLANPQLEAQTKGQLDLQKLYEFIGSSHITTLSGNLVYDINLAGKINTKTDNFSITKASGKMDVTDAAIQLSSSAVAFTKINGMFDIKKNDAFISNLTGFAEDSDFRLDGVLRNFLPYILQKDKIMTIEADLRSDKVMLNHLIPSNSASANQFTASLPTTPTANSSSFSLPSSINLNLKTQIEHLNYGKFNAKNIKGILTLSDKKLVAKNLRFKANKGTYQCTTELEEIASQQFLWSIDLTAKEVDVENLFLEMDNFGQTVLTSDNIKGKVNLSLETSTLLDHDMVPIKKSIITKADLAIAKGELRNQSSLLEIAEYLDEHQLVNKIVDTKKLTKKLQHVKFSDLSNTILIKNETLTIPQMEINTNALNLKLSGTHAFDDNIDYHFRFDLRDVLIQKKNAEDFGPLIDDGLGKKLFLHMYGPLDNPTYELDKKERKVELKENIQIEKQTTKSILKSEFGLFKNDTSVSNYKQPTDPVPTFEIEWEEFDENDATDQEQDDLGQDDQKKIKENKDKGINKLFQKWGLDKGENKNKESLEIEFDE